MKLLALIFVIYSTVISAKSSFHIQYYGQLDCKGRDVVYLDLFNYGPLHIKKCKDEGAKYVMAYFSSQFSSWYPDSGGDCLGHGPEVCRNKFKKEYLGKKLDHWKGEKWVDVNHPGVRQIMIERIELAKKKGYDGIDVDNTDFYHFKTGFDQGKTDSIMYIKFFIYEAKKLGLKYSLKNSMDIIPALDDVDFYQNESCHKYNECKVYNDVTKPIFIIEYSKCPKNLYRKGYVIIKRSGMTYKDKVCEI